MDASGRLVALIAAVYGLLFGVAVFGKVDGWRSWSRALNGFLPGRPRVAALTLVAVPFTEAVVVVLTLGFPKLGLLAAAGVLAVFAVVVAALRSRHQDEECNCFGAIATSRISATLVARNAIASAFAIAVGVAAWGVDVPRLRPTHVLVLILLGSILTIGGQFRNFVHVQQRRLSG
jgi:hypothetical protein